MPIEAACSCGAKYRVNDSFAGKSAKCKKCGSVFKISAPKSDDLDDFLNISQADAALPGQAPINKKRAVRAGDPNSKKRRPIDDDEEQGSAEKAYVSPYESASLEQRIASRQGGVSRAESGSNKIRDIFFILVGIGIIWCSQYVYGYFASWEQEGGGPRRMHVVVLIAYKIGGKIGAAIAVALLGVVAILAGALSLFGFIQFDTDSD